jgi:hypothetical protein
MFLAAMEMIGIAFDKRPQSYSAFKMDDIMDPNLRIKEPMDMEQLCRDWAELEEDDECVFYPVALFDETGREYQSFSLYKRDTVSRVPYPS